MEHLGAGAVQRVDDAGDVRLVARDRVRGDHDDVVAADLHVLVLVRGHQRERAHRLALRSGADDADLARRVARHLFDVDHAAHGDVEHAHLAAERDVVDHRATEERHLAPGVDRRLRDLAHPVQVRREAARRSSAGSGSRGTPTRSVSPTVDSDGVKPGRHAFVESESSSFTPPERWAMAPMSERSVLRPSTGVGSSLKSPLCRMVPAGVWYAVANACGTECVTGMNSQSNGPICGVRRRAPGSARCGRASRLPRCGCGRGRATAASRRSAPGRRGAGRRGRRRGPRARG